MMGRTLERKPKPNTNQKLLAQQLASWVLNEAVQTPTWSWLVLDNFQSEKLRADTRDFVIALADRVTTGVFPDRCRLILIGFDHSVLAIDPGRVDEERIGAVLPAEIATCVSEVVARAPVPVSARSLLSFVGDRLPNGEARMKELNSRLRALIMGIDQVGEALPKQADARLPDSPERGVHGPAGRERCPLGPEEQARGVACERGRDRAMTDDTGALLEGYRRRRSERLEPKTEPIEPRRRAYRQAAAVLHRFSPAEIRPFGVEPGGEVARILLFEDVERAMGEWSEGLFSLKAAVRRTALVELRTREGMRAALGANPSRPRSDLQTMWEDYLGSGAFPPLESLSYRDLNNLGQILEWVRDLEPGLPSQETVLDLARRKSVLAAFEHLVRPDFTGRRRESAALREHVRASTTPQGQKPILALHGPGGIGKTALIGRLLVEQASAQAEARVPFAYLTFDHASLRIEAPLTLLLEAASQFELQLPEERAAIEQFRDTARRVREARADYGQRRQGATSRGERIAGVRNLDRDLHVGFASLLTRVGRRDPGGRARLGPVLVVFDTFEEVQYRDRESLSGFWRMLDTIWQEYPALRVVLSGRGPVLGLGGDASRVLEMPLSELDPEDRIALLSRLGVENPSVAAAVAAQVGGNPLSLHLAAGVLRSDPRAASAGGIEGLGTPNWLLFQVDQEIIQGQLYERLLDHIHDDNVRTLAHPGMVLRRVTPEVILEVLAPLLLESVSDPAEAERLFRELKREHALVTIDGDALVYRPEIRRAMVRLLEQDRYGSVRKLHRAAVHYYSQREGVPARAEELYHRLALGEDEPWVLDSRWLAEIEQSVVSGLEEYPDPMKAWLASRASLEVPRSVFVNAGTADWERNTTRKVQKALSELQIDWALALLGERSERTPASPLFALAAKTHMLAGNLQEAALSLQAGIERVSESTNRGRLAELFWLQSQVLLLDKRPEQADRSLAQAEKAIAGTPNPTPLVHVLSHRLLLRRQHPALYDERTSALRLRLDQACQRVDETTVYEADFVIRLALDLLENEYPSTKARLGAFVESGLPPFSGDPLTSENLNGLDEYREPWELERGPFGRSGPAPEALA